MDQEMIVKLLTLLFVDDETKVPLMDYAFTLHQLSLRKNESVEEETKQSDNLKKNQKIIFPFDVRFNDAQTFWNAFRIINNDRDNTQLSESDMEALKSEIKFQHQQRHSAEKPTNRRASSLDVRRRKSCRASTDNGENQGDDNMTNSPTTKTTRLVRVRKVSKPKSGGNHTCESPLSSSASRGRSPNPHGRSISLTRRTSSRQRRRSISAPRIIKEFDPDIVQTPKSRASSRSKGRTRRLSIGKKSPRKIMIYDDEEEIDAIVDNTAELSVTETSPGNQVCYLSTQDVKKIQRVMTARRSSIKPSLDDNASGRASEAVTMNKPASSSAETTTKSPKSFKHQHDAVIRWVRMTPKKTTSRLHSGNNSDELLSPHARQLQTIPMGSLFSFKSDYDT